MLSRDQFVTQVLDVSQKYIDDNTWFHRFVTDWRDVQKMVKLVLSAYKLYRATATNTLKLTLLGGTEIRSDDAYIRNFGVTGASGIQDDDTARYVVTEIMRRDARARNVDPNANNPDNTQVPVLGGSILSEKDWSPLLNDALIIGSVTSHQLFSLALTVTEQADWLTQNYDDQGLNPQQVEAEEKKRKMMHLKRAFGHKIDCKRAWEEFFDNHEGMLWNQQDNCPRVFARELLGLSCFEYEPIFTWHEVYFRLKKGKAPRPRFDRYIQKLRDVGFENGAANKATIMGAVNDFLFG